MTIKELGYDGKERERMTAIEGWEAKRSGFFKPVGEWLRWEWWRQRLKTQETEGWREVSEHRERGSVAETSRGVSLTEETLFPLQWSGRRSSEMDPGKCEGCGERNQDLEGISAPHPPFSPRNKRTGSGLSEDHQSPVEVLPSASQPGQGWGFTKGGAGRGLKKNRWRCCTVWSRLVREGAEERRELAH